MKPIKSTDLLNLHAVLSKKELSTNKKQYILRVKGNSMIEDGIIDNDIIIFREEKIENNKHIAVAIIDDNATIIRKIYKDGRRTHSKLHTPNQPSLPFYNKNKELEVQGVVVKIIRNLDNELKDMTLSYKKKVLLDSIKSTNPNSRNKYKRVALSPIRYAGGKSLAVGYVIELLPDSIKRVVSPFFGGGSIEIAMSKELDLEVIGYDIFDILCNYWKYQIENPRLLYERLKELTPDKETFEQIRFILNDVWRKKIELDPLTLAVYYVFNFNLSYGPGFMGWSSKIYLNSKRYRRMIEKIRDFNPKNLQVKCADFQEVIKKHSNDFLYCDPPYYIGEDSKMFKGIYPMRNIPIHHNGFPHDILRDLLKEHKGGFILSYNDCPTIREYYKEFKQFFPNWQYTMGQGETRIGENRIKNGSDHTKKSHEIIVYGPPQNR